MIKLMVDEAYAFDYYSIFELKFKNNFVPLKTVEGIKENLISELGLDKFTNVINSREYEDLLKANKLTFDAVDMAKTDEVKASYVDICNYQRMLAKKALQNKFFTNKLTEIKIGYDKLKNFKNE